MNDRIKMLRKMLGLSQDKFGARIKITGASISLIESGTNVPSSQTIAMICSEFRVREAWLRTGEGEMFEPKEENPAAEIIRQYNFSGIVAKVLEVYATLTEEQQQIVLKYTQDLILSLTSDADHADIDVEVEAYRRQLELEKSAQASSVSPATDDLMA